jgi:hypothetical protein
MIHSCSKISVGFGLPQFAIDLPIKKLATTNISGIQLGGPRRIHHWNSGEHWRMGYDRDNHGDVRENICEVVSWFVS